jgi:hypothetical protein
MHCKMHTQAISCSDILTTLPYHKWSMWDKTAHQPTESEILSFLFKFYAHWPNLRLWTNHVSVLFLPLQVCDTEREGLAKCLSLTEMVTHGVTYTCDSYYNLLGCHALCFGT